MPFTHPNQENTTVTKAKWFALPDVKENAPRSCTYTLVCEATVDGVQVRGTKDWVVELTAYGETSRPKLTGDVTIDSEERPKIGGGTGTVWFVKDKGNLARTAATIKSLPEESSEFFAKIKAHEERHVWQWSHGPWSGYWDPDAYFQKVKTITSNVSEEALRKTIADRRRAYEEDQLLKSDTTSHLREKDAHQISDPIGPPYIPKKPQG